MNLSVVEKIHLPIGGESDKFVTGAKIKTVTTDHSEPKFCPWQNCFPKSQLASVTKG